MNEKNETMNEHGLDILNFNKKSETTAIKYVATVLNVPSLTIFTIFSTT